ncbi:hypothetical protein KGO95_00005 [Patescibacteria group bacterium]|nr:hypothetical protein [Patescibacteria group bacterium]
MIYTALVGVAGVFLNQTLLSVLKLQNSQDASTEVNQQIDFVLKNIQTEVRDSSEIDTDANVATTTLKLRMADPALDPTTIYTSGTTIYMKKGTASPLALTNSKVNADQLQFTKVTAYPGHDSVQVNISLSYNTTNTQSAFTKTLTSAVARVSAATFDSDIVPGTDNTYSVGQTSARWQNLLLSGGAGIGVTSLANSLDVNGGAAFGTFAGANTAPTGGLIVSGQVGIGTANPGAIGATGLSYTYSPALEVNGTGSIGAVIAIAGANSAELDFIHSGGAANTKQIFLRQANQKLEFSSTDDAGNYKHANILEVDGNQGYVGIGTSTPNSALDANGTIYSETGGFKFPDGTVQSTASLGSGIPANTIAAFNQSTCPTGWILADGTSGTPDLRGMFVRGAGTNGTYTNANGAFFSGTLDAEQNDQLQGFEMSVPIGVSASGYQSLVQGSSPTGGSVGTIGFRADGANGTPRTGAETRPANIALTYCMKTTADSATSNSIWGTSGSSTYVQDTTQNVGIGTTSPSAKLTIGGTPGVDGIKFPDGSMLTGAPGSSIAENGSTYFSSPVSTSRACSTVYTNNTSKPIFVAAQSGLLSNGNVVAGFFSYLGTPSAKTNPTYLVQASVTVNNGGASGSYASAFFIVPPGYAYQINAASGYGSCPATWTEYQ